MTAVKHDGGKPRLELIPGDILLALGEVLAFGAKEYGDWNWSEGFEWSRIYGAAQRHLTAWLNGEELDPKSGLPHLWHALCNIGFLIVHQKRKLGKDDRHKWPSSGGTGIECGSTGLDPGNRC